MTNTNQYQNNLKIQPFSMVILVLILIVPLKGWANNNMQFLDSSIIKSLQYSIYEVVVPKVENKASTGTFKCFKAPLTAS